MRLIVNHYFPALTGVHPTRSKLNIVSWHLLINSDGISVPKKWHAAIFSDSYPLSLKCHPISSPHCLFTSSPCLPLPVLSSHIHLGGVPDPCHAAGVCVLHKLLVWLQLATFSVLYFLCSNYKLRCIPHLSLCHRHSSLCYKRQKEAVGITFEAQRTAFWQRT